VLRVRTIRDWDTDLKISKAWGMLRPQHSATQQSAQRPITTVRCVRIGPTRRFQNHSSLPLTTGPQFGRGAARHRTSLQLTAKAQFEDTVTWKQGEERRHRRLRSEMRRRRPIRRAGNHRRPLYPASCHSHAEWQPPLCFIRGASAAREPEIHSGRAREWYSGFAAHGSAIADLRIVNADLG